MSNIKDIFSEQLSDEQTYFLEEGLFDVSPIVSIFALKDSAVQKIKDAGEKISHPATQAIGKVRLAQEKVKAKTTGKSGKTDKDVVYKLTTEQNKVLAYIYKKYGAELVKEITKFRNDVMLPYQIIKKNVAQNKTLTNKEVFGMTKEEYYRYRESGRRKIEKMGTYFKDSSDLRNSTTISRASLNKANNVLRDFKAGKIIDLSSTNIEKLLSDCGLSREKLGGWSDSTLEKTFTKIRELEEKLKNQKLETANGIRVFGRENSSKALYQDRESIEMQIKNLRDNGVAKKDLDSERHTKKFSEAFAVYALRKEKMREIKNNCSSGEYKILYTKILQDAVDAAKRNYEEKFSNYASLKGTIELNQFESKIWKLKTGGIKMSGNIEDWKLAIKPEQFFETKYYKKSEKILAAERDVDAALKRFERSLKKKMSEQDLELCKEHRLFNNFYTVKELKSADKMFKKAPEFKSTDVSSEINSIIGKEYDTIKDLESAQEKAREFLKQKLSASDKEKIEKFISKIDPKNNSSATKISRETLQNKIDKALNTPLTGITLTNELLKDLEDCYKDFEALNGKKEASAFEFDFNKAKSRLVSWLQKEE